MRRLEFRVRLPAGRKLIYAEFSTQRNQIIIFFFRLHAYQDWTIVRPILSKKQRLVQQRSRRIANLPNAFVCDLTDADGLVNGVNGRRFGFWLN